MNDLGRVADSAEQPTQQVRRLRDLFSCPVESGREATDELARALMAYDSPRTRIEKQLREHQERASFLAFLRDHLSAEDVYRLDSSDLRMAEILPDKAW